VTSLRLTEFEHAIRSARGDAPEDSWFRLKGVVYIRERGQGFYVWVGQRRIVFDANAEAALETVVESLVSDKHLGRRIGKDFIRDLVFEAAASAAATLFEGRAVDFRAVLEGVRENLAAQRMSVVVFPVRDLCLQEARKFGPVLIGHVGSAFERQIDRELRSSGSEQGFRFTGELELDIDPDHGRGLSQRHEDEGPPRYDARQVAVAILTPMRGELATGDGFLKLDLFLGALVFFAMSHGSRGFRIPSVGYVRDEMDVHYGVFDETADVVTVDPDRGDSDIRIGHGWEILELADVMRGSDATMARRLLTLDARGSSAECDERFGRFLLWLLRSARATSFVDRLVSAVIAIEVLLGTEKGAPISATVAERAAFLLPATNGQQRLQTAQQMRDLYDHRNALVHGGRLSSPESANDLFVASQDAQALAVRLGRAFLRHRSAFSVKDGIRLWFEKRKYGDRGKGGRFA